jgi:XrtJ-associated TM-motif-TM protein
MAGRRFARPLQPLRQRTELPGRDSQEFEEIMKIKKTILPFGFALMLAAALPLLRAQTGCDDSPEDPTILLALLGGAGALAASLWRARSSNR